jgi:hypothetical protein
MVKKKNVAAAALGRLGGLGKAGRKIEANSGKNPAAVALGRLGGMGKKGRTSEANSAAARANGKKGGRPKMTAAQRAEQIRQFQTVKCPKCAAKPVAQCVDLRSGAPLAAPHPERVAACKATAKMSRKVA